MNRNDKNNELGTLETLAGVQIVKFVVPLLFLALVVILLVFLAISVIWAAFAFFVDWWFAWCGIPIVVAAIAYYKASSEGPPGRSIGSKLRSAFGAAGRNIASGAKEFVGGMGEGLEEVTRPFVRDSKTPSAPSAPSNGANGGSNPNSIRWQLITAMVIPGIIAVVMIGFGISGKSAVWTGTGFTRGPDAWVSPWNDDCGRPIWDDNYEKSSCS